MEVTDVFGEAIYDYYHNRAEKEIIVHERGEVDDYMPVEYLFRNEQEMPELELIALQHCSGRILDVGAGAGSHSLVLQQRNADVEAVDISAKAVEVMTMRGVRKARVGNFFDIRGEKYDTLLLMMNGIGIAGSLNNLHRFFQQADILLNQGGIIITESTDLLYHATDAEKKKVLKLSRYYGELNFQMEYKKRLSGHFDWLFVDIKTLRHYAEINNFMVELLFVNEDAGYLVKMSRIK